MTISDEVYRKLLAVKGKDESFSELLERLTEGTRSIDILTSLRGQVEFREKAKMLSELLTERTERRI